MVIHHYQQFYAGACLARSCSALRKLTRRLAERGHHVLVVACDFNAYSEQTEPEEDMAFPGGGRVKVYMTACPAEASNQFDGTVEGLWLVCVASVPAGKPFGPPNVVLGSIQPLFTGFAALQDARAHKAPFVLEVRDLWPDALVAKGAITQWQAKPMYWMEARLYARAQRVVSLTPGIKVELLRKGVSRERLDVLPNAFDAEAYRLEPNTRERVRKEHGWDNRFVVVYTGAHTEVTAVDTLVRAAHVLRDRQDIRFELFGAGQTKALCPKSRRKPGADKHRLPGLGSQGVDSADSGRRGCRPDELIQEPSHSYLLREQARRLHGGWNTHIGRHGRDAS